MVRPAFILEERCFRELRAVIVESLNDELRYIELISSSDPVPLYSFQQDQIYFGERALEQILKPEVPIALFIPDSWAYEAISCYELGSFSAGLLIAAMTRPGVDRRDEDEAILQKRICRYGQAVWNLLSESSIQDRLSLAGSSDGRIKSFRVLRHVHTPLRREGEVCFKGINFNLVWQIVP